MAADELARLAEELKLAAYQAVAAVSLLERGRTTVREVEDWLRKADEAHQRFRQGVLGATVGVGYRPCALCDLTVPPINGTSYCIECLMTGRAAEHEAKEGRRG